MKKPTKINTHTGASVTGGDPSVTTIASEDSKINAGCKLRFETAVEDQKYHTDDLEVALTTDFMIYKTYYLPIGKIEKKNQNMLFPNFS